MEQPKGSKLHGMPRTGGYHPALLGHLPRFRWYLSPFPVSDLLVQLGGSLSSAHNHPRARSGIPRRYRQPGGGRLYGIPGSHGEPTSINDGIKNTYVLIYKPRSLTDRVVFSMDRRVRHGMRMVSRLDLRVGRPSHK